jgi:dTDP-4-dehydrorhamnose 3,5-epimerase
VKVLPTRIAGAFLIEPEPVADDRGFFVRTFSEEEFRANGMEMRVRETGVSFSPGKGTLRGMHYQAGADAEAKLVRCTRGAIYDVIVDLRDGSWFGVELSEETPRMLYVPKGMAHGFLTLAGNTEVTYLLSEEYRAGAAAGVRWNDPAFAIEWPIEVQVISERDRTWPAFKR